jgi:hypothetical protein
MRFRRPNRTLMRALIRAHRWRAQLESGAASSIEAIGRQENVNATYVRSDSAITVRTPPGRATRTNVVTRWAMREKSSMMPVNMTGYPSARKTALYAPDPTELQFARHTTFKLPSLGYADVPADDLSDCFNLTQTPLASHVIPAALGAAHFINDKRPPTDPDDD